MRCVASHSSAQAFGKAEKVGTETDGMAEVSLGTAGGATCHIIGRNLCISAREGKGFVPSQRAAASLDRGGAGLGRTSSPSLGLGDTPRSGVGEVGGEAATFKTVRRGRIGAVHASHEQGRPRTRWQTALLRRRRRAALAGRSSSQVGLCSGGGGGGCL
eukprot:924144-Pleurochrysis_carterae.AAC.1